MSGLQHAPSGDDVVRWQDVSVAPEGTHHLRDDSPLYAARFDEVMKFHEPGLAPVRRGDEAWHIRTDGSASYRRRFFRAFGFYDGLAAVQSSSGWHHIRSDGTDLAPARFGWCGNFQEGLCAVRGRDGSYSHITREGNHAYDTRWRYAGDFRDGVAVVQFGDGRSSHIDSRGLLVHGVRFLDLDVYHKRFARARDEDGWMHVDTTGRPLYKRRFAAVEPFYNGQARVECLDGGLQVIDEEGGTMVTLRPPLKSDFAALSSELTGFWRTQTVCAAVELGVFEALPVDTEGVAGRCDMDTARARRLMRALAELHLVEAKDGVWRTSHRGAYLTQAHHLTLADAAREYGRRFSRIWETLPGALKSGKDWDVPDIFRAVATDPACVGPHHRMLASYARHDYAAVPAALGLRGDEHIIDAGGGFGALAELLVDEYPDLRVTVLDLPEVIEQACSRDQEERLVFRGADLFKSWRIEGDAVLLARVIHDWDDVSAVRILRQARRVLPKGGRLFVVEMVLPENSSMGGLCDLHLLVANGGGERTEAEYAALLYEAAFEVDEVRSLPALPSILKATAR